MVSDTGKPHDLTYEQRIKSLAHIILLELKNKEFKIKLKGFADGRNQRNCISKDDT